MQKKNLSKKKLLKETSDNHLFTMLLCCKIYKIHLVSIEIAFLLKTKVKCPTLQKIIMPLDNSNLWQNHVFNFVCYLLMTITCKNDNTFLMGIH